LHQLLDYLIGLGPNRVWLAKRADIASHWRAHHPPPVLVPKAAAPAAEATEAGAAAAAVTEAGAKVATASAAAVVAAVALIEAMVAVTIAATEVTMEAAHAAAAALQRAVALRQRLRQRLRQYAESGRRIYNLRHNLSAAATMKAFIDAFEGGEGKEELRKLFHSIDIDGSGVVSSKEWGKAIGQHWKLMGRFFGGLTVGEVGQMFKKLDADGSGDLTWDEFETALQQMDWSVRLAQALESQSGAAELKALWDRLDKNGDGKVSGKEWGSAVHEDQQVMAKYFGGKDLKVIGKMFSKIDADGSGDLTWDEFVNGSIRLVHLPNLDEFVKGSIRLVAVATGDAAGDEADDATAASSSELLDARSREHQGDLTSSELLEARSRELQGDLTSSELLEAAPSAPPPPPVPRPHLPFTGPRLLITGGGGFVLSHVVVAWLAQDDASQTDLTDGLAQGAQDDAPAAATPAAATPAARSASKKASAASPLSSCVVFDRHFDAAALAFLREALASGRLQLFTGDVGDVHSWSQLVDAHGSHFSHMVLGAALTPTADEEAQLGAEVLRVNFVGVLHALELARSGSKFGCPALPRVVLVSSDAVR